jgi:hypothetical protein
MKSSAVEISAFLPGSPPVLGFRHATDLAICTQTLPFEEQNHYFGDRSTRVLVSLAASCC